MRIGVIDLGTNSVRFDIHEVIQPGFLRALYREKSMVRLGQEVFRTQQLSGEAMRRTMAALRSFKKVCIKYECDLVVGAGTSAIRDSANGKSFLKQIKNELGFDIQVIAGKQEAALILKGILTFEPMVRDSVAFVDIGGGSTEVGVCQRSEVLYLDSFPLGAARLGQKFLSPDPKAYEIEGLRFHIRKLLGEKCGFKEWPKLEILFGASGTIKALVRIMDASGFGKIIERKNLGELVHNMSALSQRDLMCIPGMEERRTDIILPGAILLEELMDFFRARRVYRTRYALREGLLQQELERLDLAITRSKFEKRASR